ncbi:MAG: hypothetical protein ACQKBU_05790 [Verrucomicrobiales bacterium]
MVRTKTILLLIFLLGTLLPAAALVVCPCSEAAEMDFPCCGSDHDADESETSPCCGEPDCCVELPDLPDGQEPSTTRVPVPLPAPQALEATGATPPTPLAKRIGNLIAIPRPPPPDATPIRITCGIWRL